MSIKDFLLLVAAVFITVLVVNALNVYFPMPLWIFGVLHVIVFFVVIKGFVDPIFYQ